MFWFLEPENLVVLGIGLLLGFLTMRHRDEWGAKDGEQPTFSFMWLMTTTFCWPLLVLAKIMENFAKAKRVIREWLDPRPAKWYDWLFAWAYW